MTNVRHILGISGGKDSAALSIYLKQKYPQMEIEYYNSDTGCELEETERLIDKLEAYLGSIKRLRAAERSPEATPFDHFLKACGGFLPSPQARWCTQKMKLNNMLEMIMRYLMSAYAVMKIVKDTSPQSPISKRSFLSEEIFGALTLLIRFSIMISGNN